MNIEQFNEKHLAAIARFCNEHMERDTMNEALLRENTIDDADFDPELTLAAFDSESGEPLGFIMSVIRHRDDGPMGYVKLLCVDKEHRREGIARTLYLKTEDVMKQRGVKKIRAYESWPNYFMPGVDPYYTEAICFFERMKFKKIGDTSNLLSDLRGQDFSTEVEENNLLKENIVCRRAEEKDKDEIFKWIASNFAAWKYEVESSFKNDPISLHIALKDDVPLAFSAHEANNKGLGWFGPMGTEEALRGKGVGGILLKRCLKDMQDMGYTHAIIPWVGPIPFYMHYSGARFDRPFWRYEKEVS